MADRSVAPKLCEYVPIQNLYAAGRLLVRIPRRRSAWRRLKKALRGIEQAAHVSESLAQVRRAAERIYFLGAPDCNAIEIDELNFTHPSGSGGYWVSAWLWVPDEDL
ncbi:MAG: hypothetical protein U0744_13585 [Gemmataceae bacterium]